MRIRSTRSRALLLSLSLCCLSSVTDLGAQQSGPGVLPGTKPYGSGGAVTSPILAPAATCAAPAYSFSAHTDRGFIDDTTNNGVGACVGGNEIGVWTATGLMFTADNTKDIGATAATRPRTGYFATSVVSPSFTTPSASASFSLSARWILGSGGSDGRMAFTDSGGSNGVLLNVATDSTMQVLSRGGTDVAILRSNIVNASTGIQINSAATSGNFLVGNGTNFVSTALAFTHANPADQTGNGTATFKMNGLGSAASACTITPTATGRVVLMITGNQAQNTTADGVTFKIAYGSGAAPANGAAATGTVISATQTWTGLTGQLQTGFAITASVTGLTLNTAYWYDLQIADVTGGTASVKNIDCTAIEQ